MFVGIWVNLCIEYPEIIAADKGPQFFSDEFCALCRVHEIRIKPSGIESRNAIESSERYHSVFREIYNRISHSHKIIAHDQIMQIAVHTVDDTAFPDGLVPKIIVFGVLPKLLIKIQDLPDQHMQFDALMTARNEMTRLVAIVCVQRALKCHAPNTFDYDIRTNEDVFVYRENRSTGKDLIKVLRFKMKPSTSTWMENPGHFQLLKADPTERNQLMHNMNQI